MKQLLVLSGKGGTGKTTIASALIKLAEAKVYADCDVDAPNLHLITRQRSEPKKSNYYGLPKAKIDFHLCSQCDQCRQHCRFDAISPQYQVEPFACEGCGVCEAICPVGAVSLKPAVAGELMLYADETQVFSTGQLRIGSGNSGKLVSKVKKQMQGAAPKTEIAIIDGSPGIGCPVIASLSGVNMVLIVAEPSLSSISDLQRIIETAATFGIKAAVCVNKYDTNMENTEKIEELCRTQGLPFMGRIPYDEKAIKAINNGQTIVDVDCPSGQGVKALYQKIMRLLFEED
ncbi:MAG: ATP-binding protein [Limnochordia bacterium]|jgi:MinD superfamily P-loop ATPase